MKTEDILFACVITPLIVIFFISIAYLIISIMDTMKQRVFENDILSRLKNKILIIRYRYGAYNLRDGIDVLINWEWRVDSEEKIFYLAPKDGTFINYIEMQECAPYSNCINYRHIDRVPHIIPSKWNYKEIQQLVFDKSGWFNLENIGTIKLVEPHKILHEYIATVYDISCDIFHFTDGFAFKSIAKAAIFLKNVRLCTDMTSFFVRVLPYYEKNKKHIFNLIKMEVQRIEKEKLKEKNPFPL